MLSQTSRYALTAALALAQRPDRWVRAQDLAVETGIPANYLTKILHTMARARLLRSQRGRQGGFRLARRPEAISLLEVVSLFEEPHFLSYCLLGTESCPADRPCLAHQRWLAAVEAIARFLHSTSLADIATTPDGSPVGPLTVQWSESASRTSVGFAEQEESYGSQR